MRCLDLFSGIGGFSLGLERAGMETVGVVIPDPDPDWKKRMLVLPQIPQVIGMAIMEIENGTKNTLCNKK